MFKTKPHSLSLVLVLKSMFLSEKLHNGLELTHVKVINKRLYLEINIAKSKVG